MNLDSNAEMTQQDERDVETNSKRAETVGANATSRSGVFDYSKVPEQHRSPLEAAAASIKARLKEPVRRAYFFGNELSKIKRLIEHGLFTEWVENEVGMGLRTAERYMLLFDRLGGHIANLEHLPLSLLYKLTAIKVPAAAIKEVVSMARRRLVTAAEVRAIIKRYTTSDPTTSDTLSSNPAYDLIASRFGDDLGDLAPLLSPENIRDLGRRLWQLAKNAKRTRT